MPSQKKPDHASEVTGNLFQKFIEEAPIAIAIISSDGKIEFINKKAVELFGYEMKDLHMISDWWSMAVPRKTYYNMTASSGAVPVSSPNEFVIPCKNGDEKIVKIAEVRIENKMLSIIDDITQRVLMEEAFYESQQHYRLISELTTDYLYKLKIDADGNVSVDYMSDNYQQITGRSKDEAAVSLWSKFLHPDDLNLIMEQLREMAAKPCTKEVQCRSIVHGNKQRWVNIVSRSEWNPVEQRITSIYGAVKDITERKNAELEIKVKNDEIEAQNREYLLLNAELMKTNVELKEAKEKAEESDRLKTSFLQNMSHEIRTPMNAIMGFSSLIPENLNNPAKLSKFAGIINQRCNDLIDIINGILDIAKIESGQEHVNLESCNLIDLCSELSSFYREQQKKNGKEHIRFAIHVLLDPAHAIIFTDKVKLKQIMINLISNAFKFTSEGFIEAGCKPDNHSGILFYVSDTGIGIPQDKYEMIFKRFSQIGDGRLKSYGGTGLGLSIVKGLVHLLGGNIWLESVPQDDAKGIKGHTTFYFKLPTFYQKQETSKNTSESTSRN